MESQAGGAEENQGTWALRAALVGRNGVGLRCAGEVNGGLVVVVVDVPEVHHHVEGVGQHQEEDEGGDQSHQHCRGQEGCAVGRRRELPRKHVEGLELQMLVRNTRGTRC